MNSAHPEVENYSNLHKGYKSVGRKHTLKKSGMDILIRTIMTIIDIPNNRSKRIVATFAQGRKTWRVALKAKI